MPLTGDAKREYQQGYMRKVRRDAKAVAAAITGAVVAGSTKPRKFPADVQHVAQGELRKAMERNGLLLDRTLRKVAEKHDAMTMKTIAKVATRLEDNDAQLRAADLAIRLHERAGSIPAAPVEGRGGGGVAVEIVFVMPGQPQDVVGEASRDQAVETEVKEIT